MDLGHGSADVRLCPAPSERDVFVDVAVRTDVAVERERDLLRLPDRTRGHVRGGRNDQLTCASHTRVSTAARHSHPRRLLRRAVVDGHVRVRAQLEQHRDQRQVLRARHSRRGESPVRGSRSV